MTLLKAAQRLHRATISDFARLSNSRAPCSARSFNASARVERGTRLEQVHTIRSSSCVALEGTAELLRSGTSPDSETSVTSGWARDPRSISKAQNRSARTYVLSECHQRRDKGRSADV